MFRLIVILIAIVFSSCFSYKDLEYRSFEGINVEKLDGDDVHIGLSVKVFNPNSYTIKIKSADLEASFNGNDLGDVTLVNTVSIAPNQESLQKVVCKVSGKKILSMLPLAFLTGSSKLTLTGNLKVKVFLFSKKFPVSVSEDINLKL